MRRATAINASGMVVGTDSDAGFIWTPNQPKGTVGSLRILPSDTAPPEYHPVTSAAPQAVNSAASAHFLRSHSKHFLQEAWKLKKYFKNN